MMPLPAPSDLLSAPPSPKAQPGRVLFTLGEMERAWFFPHGFHLPSQEVFAFSNQPGGPSLRDALRESAAEAVVTSWWTPPFEEDWLEDLPSLSYICHTSGSVRNLVPRAYLENGIQVTNWGTIASPAVAEHALLLILAGLRRLPEWPDVIAGKLPWHPTPVATKTLFGKRVGLHGFGQVARCLAELLRPFGVTIQAYSSGVPREFYELHQVTAAPSLDALFAQSDILVECEALTPQSLGTVTREVLRQLPPGALFVNVARGALVDEAALADLAREGRLRLALDVFATDPIGPDSPLHQVEGAVLSPHIAGPTGDQIARCGALVLRNLRAFFARQPLEALVTLEIYDRST